MASDVSADGKNSLVGEFLLALARSPEPVQESVIVQGLKAMMPYRKTLIDPYPMMSHLAQMLAKQGRLGDVSE